MTAASCATDAACPLPLNEIHVWLASVTALAPEQKCLSATLNDAERAKAARFLSAHDRDRYVVAHGVLRSLLAAYLGAEASSIRFETAARGKPRLVHPATDLTFNLSHSGDAVVIGIARVRHLGIDIEQIADAVECITIADAFFSPAERRALAATAPALQRDAFFACWARKEAYVKATGVGVTEGLDHFDVTVGRAAALLDDRHDAHARTRWTIRTLALREGYAAALAFEGGDAHVITQRVAPTCLAGARSLPPR